jgi:hypothetical protein
MADICDVINSIRRYHTIILGVTTQKTEEVNRGGSLRSRLHQTLFISIVLESCGRSVTISFSFQQSPFSEFTFLLHKLGNCKLI